MPNQKIVEYIKGQLAIGMDINKIRSDLMMNGSLPSEIDLAFNSLNNPVVAESIATPVPPSIPTPPAYTPTSTPIPTPTSIPTYSPVNTAPFITEQSTKSSLGKIITITVIVLILLGGASAGAYFGFNYYKSKQITLGKAVINTIEAISTNKIKSGEFTVVTEVNAKNVGENYADLATDDTSKQIASQIEDIAFNLTYTGIVNQTVDKEYETSGELGASIKNPNGGSIGMFGPQELDLKYKTFSDDVYVSVAKIPAITSMFIPPAIDTNKYLNQWFSLPSEMTKETSKSFMDGFTANGTRNNNLATTTISIEGKKEIINLFDNSGAFTVIDTKNEKTDKGTDVTALYLKIDLDKLGDEVIRLIKKDKVNTFTKSQEMELRTNLEKMKEAPVTNVMVKVLIGKDNYLQGIVSTGDLMDESNKIVGSYKTSFVAENINKSFTIDRPTNTRNIMEVMTEINTLMMSPKKASSND
jgi:hypothetical protein